MFKLEMLENNHDHFEVSGKNVKFIFSNKITDIKNQEEKIGKFFVSPDFGSETDIWNFVDETENYRENWNQQGIYRTYKNGDHLHILVIFIDSRKKINLTINTHLEKIHSIEQHDFLPATGSKKNINVIKENCLKKLKEENNKHKILEINGILN